MPLLELRQVGRAYRASRESYFRPPRLIHAVSDVSFTLERGKILGLVGESGCGKSTTGRMAAGLDAPDHGEVLFDGLVVPAGPGPEWRKLRHRMQMVFQDSLGALDRRMIIADQIAEPMVIHGIGSPQIRTKRVAELLAAVGLAPEHGLAHPLQLSGGQRQRVGIARALAAEPELLVCDEPVSALDVSTQAQVIAFLTRLQRERNLALLFISHDLKLVATLADEIAVMYLGRIVEQGSPADMFRSPAHPYTRILLSAIPNPFRHGPRPVLTGELPDPACRPAGCAFHPRCPQAIALCCQRAPILQRRKDGHQVACHLAQGACSSTSEVPPP